MQRNSHETMLLNRFCYFLLSLSLCLIELLCCDTPSVVSEMDMRPFYIIQPNSEQLSDPTKPNPTQIICQN